MIHKSSITEAWRSLYASKQRTILALIGIMIGIGSVIAMISVGQIVSNESLKQFMEMGTDLVSIEKDYSDDSSTLSKKAKYTLDTALKLKQQIPAIKLMSPVVTSYGDFSLRGAKGGVSIIGITPEFIVLNRLKLRAGRFISDLDKNQPYIMLGSKAFEQANIPVTEDLIGQEIRMSNRYYTIVGILEDTPHSQLMSYETNTSAIMHISTVNRNFNLKELSTIMARIKENINPSSLVQVIKGYYSKTQHGLSVRVTTAEQLLKQMEKQMQLFTLLLGAIGSISLVVGGVGVMNVMLVSVTERKKEIGIRRALGAKRSDIQNQFLIEAMILSMVGGVIGIVSGIAVAYALSIANNWEYIMSYFAIILGVGVSSSVGIFFGYYPAYQAARLDPITALRS